MNALINKCKEKNAQFGVMVLVLFRPGVVHCGFLMGSVTSPDPLERHGCSSF